MIHHVHVPQQPIRRRTLFAGAAAVPAAGMLVACSDNERPAEAGAPEPSGQPDEVRYVTNFGELGRDAYAHVAEAQGHFADRSINATIEPGSGTNSNLQALLAGTCDFTVVDMAGAMIYRGDTGEDGYVALAAIQQQPLATVMALAESGINAPQDLEGRKIAFPDGAVTELLFPAYARNAGLNLNRIELIKVEPQLLGQALATGEADAIGQFVVGLPLIQAATEGREITVLPYSEYITGMYGVCLFTAVETAEEQPELCIRFRDAVLEGLQYSLENPEEAGRILNEAAPDSDAAVAGQEMALMLPYAQVEEPDRRLGDIDYKRMASSNVYMMQGLGELPEGQRPEDFVEFSLTVRPDQP